MAPTTSAGRLFCILFALFGIPLNGILFASLGDYFGSKVKPLTFSPTFFSSSSSSSASLDGDGFSWISLRCVAPRIASSTSPRVETWRPFFLVGPVEYGHAQRPTQAAQQTGQTPRAADGRRPLPGARSGRLSGRTGRPLLLRRGLDVRRRALLRLHHPVHHRIRRHGAR